MELGVVGCGVFARNHLHAWTDLRARGVEITAVCDVDPTKAKTAATRFESDAGRLVETLGKPK